jgi:endo-1,4-beta-xylanase
MHSKFLTRRNALLVSLATLASIGNSSKTKSQINYFQHLLSNNLNKDFQVVNQNSLKERAASKGLIYGAFPHWYDRFSLDPQFQSSFTQECSAITPGFYWFTIRNSEQGFDFTTTDYFVKFASDNKLIVRGIPLIWHDTLCEWLINKFKNPNTSYEEIKNILINHISTVVGRYAGKVHSWDVVNEAINVEDGRSDGLRDTLISGITGEKYKTWFNFLGPDFIELAFRTAAKADPNALLVYNDHTTEYDAPEHEAKRSAVFELLTRLKSSGVPIHGFGIQAHLDASINHLFNPTKFKKFLSNVASLGLKIFITELDVTDQNLPPDIDTRDRLVAEAYKDFLSVVLDEPAVISVITWGLSDRYTWLSDFTPRKDGLPVRPLPLDDQLNRKLAWNAIARAFDNAPKRDNPIKLS